MNTTEFADSMPWQERLTEGPVQWTALDNVLFSVLMVLAFELLNHISSNIGYWFRPNEIPVRGKHLDEFSQTDKVFVTLNKLCTAPFMYFYVRYAYAEPNVVMESVSIQTMILPIPVLFLVYDFFYTILHWGLHIKGVYGYIHKHHHHQKAPSRANVDAVNVHPVEYFLGEYNHLWTLYLVSHCLGVKIHAVASILFLAVGGLLAGLNHTRFDISIGRLYDSKAHDVHHRIPQSNYGQYTMFWDHVFGSFRPYDPKDRINPMAQLHPETGKSLQYMESMNQTASATPSKKSD